MRAVETEKSIRQIVRSAVEAYANGSETRHIGEIDNPNGVINMKIHNVFISALGKDANIKCHFATAYNRFGEDKEWKQTRVLQFFAKEELLIGKYFWNLVCCSDKGYEIVIDEDKKSAYLINDALENTLANNAFFEVTNKILRKIA